MGNNPKAASSVRQTNGVSWYSVPFCIIPEVGKLTEDDDESFVSQIFNIFNYDPVRITLFNESMVFVPEARSVAQER